MASKTQSGFTLIELVVVIIILGILAAVAVPKFIDLKSDAEAAAVKGVAGGVSSAFAVNYAGRAVNATKGVAMAGTVTTSVAAGNIMAGGLPAGYTLTPTSVVCGTTAALAFTVTVSGSTAGNTATATLICTG